MSQLRALVGLRWRMVRSGKAIVPWTNAVDFRSTIIPNRQFTRIYAPGSRQNHPRKPVGSRQVSCSRP